MLTALCLAVILASCACLHAQGNQRTLIEWTFDKDAEGWGGPNHISDLRVQDGALQGRIMDWDPFVRSPEFDIPATPWQTVEVRLKTDCAGGGEVFWTGTTQSQYGGFSPGKETPFTIIGDNEWHVYQVRPYWHREGKIVLLRLDLPRPDPADNGKKTFAVDYIRVTEPVEAAAPQTEAHWDFTKSAGGWTGGNGATAEKTDAGLRIVMGDDPTGAAMSSPLQAPVDDRMWVSVEMAVSKGETGTVRWVSSEGSGLQSLDFSIRADGAFHTYNIDLSSSKLWAGDILLLELTPAASAGAQATLRSLTVSEEPLGPPEIVANYAGLEDAISRAGRRLPFILNLTNRGGETATDLRIADLKLPPGVKVDDTGDWRKLPELDAFDPATHRFYVSAERPVKGEAVITLAGRGAPAEPIRAELGIEPGLNLPKADYVPEPRPVESDYEIGALYFPGWDNMAKWDPIRRTAPERKPVLGWYDEGNPECVDWQIKWAVEHGIKFFLVDWYWSAGSRHLEHWVKAFQKARYRGYLKWAMMWANHNAPNTHSEEDQRAVTQFWLDNYFNTPEYYRIDDMPVVMIWSVGNMDRDMAGKGGAKRLLDISQEMVRAAGYKGIYFIAMKWPEAGTDPAIIKPLAEDGFSMTSIYHYMDSGGKAEDPRRFPFKLCAEATYPFFRAWYEADILPFLPNLSTGWDSRPWHGDRSTVIYGRTVDLFRDICRDAKRFADATGVKRMTLAPLNEWGEGSYAEPCKEFGFGMYDAVRDTFCKKPAGGWPLNVAPQDVGLGPYDFPEPVGRFAWDFTNGTQGWGAMMGIGSVAAQDGALVFETSSPDPAITCSLNDLRASKYPYIIIRMRIDAVAAPEEKGQLFWTTPTAGTSEPASMKWELIGDGQYHDYVVHLAENSRWRGRITTFRLDPCSHAGAKVAIEGIRMSEDGK
jgi:hypothetical protein